MPICGKVLHTLCKTFPILPSCSGAKAGPFLVCCLTFPLQTSYDKLRKKGSLSPQILVQYPDQEVVHTLDTLERE